MNPLEKQIEAKKKQLLAFENHAETLRKTIAVLEVELAETLEVEAFVSSQADSVREEEQLRDYNPNAPVYIRELTPKEYLRRKEARRKLD